MEITANARKRFTDDEIKHVWEHALLFVPHEHDGEERLLIVGALPDGRLAELVAVTADTPSRIIHANWIQQNHMGYLRGLR